MFLRRLATAQRRTFSSFASSKALLALGSRLDKSRVPRRLGSIDDFKPAIIPDVLGFGKEKERDQEEERIRELRIKARTDAELRKELLKNDLKRSTVEKTENEKRFPITTFIMQHEVLQLSLGVFLVVTIIYAGIKAMDLYEYVYTEVRHMSLSPETKKHLKDVAAEDTINRLDMLKKANQSHTATNHDAMSSIYGNVGMPYIKNVDGKHFIIYMNRSGLNPMDYVEQIEGKFGKQITYEIKY